MFFLVCVSTDVFSQQLLSDTVLFNADRDSTVFYLDWWKMEPSTKAGFVKAFGEIAKRNDFYNFATVQPQENISILIKRYYDVAEGENKSTFLALISVLRDINSLDEKNTLIAGQVVKMPRLPIKQGVGHSTTFTQFFDPYIKQAYILSTSDAVKENLGVAQPKVDFSKGGLYAYKLSPADLSIVKSALSSKTYKNLLGKAILTLDSIKISTVRFPERGGGNVETTIAPMNIDTVIRNYLAGIDKKYFGTYIVFDSFNAKSKHGLKVMDVINARFASYGLDTSGLSIRRIPINYFDNLEFGRDVFSKYFAFDAKEKDSIPGINIQYESNKLINMDPTKYSFANCSDCIPEVYLHALFGYYFRTDPDVISSSFWADMQIKGVLPRLNSSSKTSLVTAGLNEDGEMENKLMNILADQELLVGQIQPLNDYFTSYDVSGAMIIGNRLKKGHYVGSYGNRVTTTGLGVGWIGKEITPIDTGTSFATPDVASKIYIAKAYWRFKRVDKKITPAEARLRVLLATDIDSALVGKFDSGGGLNLLKLLQVGNYAELTSGEIVPVTNINFADSGISSSRNDAMRFGRKMKISGETKDGICGFACIDGTFFKLSEFNSKWEPVTFKDVFLSLNLPSGHVEISSKQQFGKIFKQLIILTN